MKNQRFFFFCPHNGKNKNKRKCNFTVENTRVGQVTDYDKLILEIWTDGSVTPSEGVSIGAKIMQEHLNLFVELNDSAEGMEIMAKKISKKLFKLLADQRP